MNTLGDFDAGITIYGKFASYKPSTGGTFTLAGSPALSVYKDNSTTQSTSGVSITADFDSVTGLNHFTIDLSSDGTFYSAGSFFSVVITTGTIDGVSVTGAVVATFTIRRNSALKPATAGRTVVVDAAGLVDSTTVKIGPTGAATAQTARDVSASVLLSSGTGAGQLDITSGVASVNVTKIAGTSQTGRDIGASVLLSPGTGTGQVSLSSGRVKVQSNTVINTGISGFPFLMLDAAGVPRTGLTVTGFRSIDGAAFSSCANAATEMTNGWYKIDLAGSDVNGAVIAFRMTATGAQDRCFTVVMNP